MPGSYPPDTALPLGVHAGRWLVQEQHRGVAQHAHGEAELQKGKGLGSGLLQPPAPCLQRAVGSITLLMGTEPLVLGDTNLEDAG